MASKFTVLDIDAAFTLPTRELISPISICKLVELEDHAADQETPEDAKALVNPHLQRRPLPGPIEVLPTNTDEESSLMDQVVKALAMTLKMFQELECYIYYVSESEPVPEDYEVVEADDEQY